MEDQSVQTQAEIEAILGILTELTGLPSRWSGNVELVPDAEFKGRKPFRCDIQIDAALVTQDVRWRTLIHEAFHCLSAGYNGSDFRDFPGWEEGVAEFLQRAFRPIILTRLGIHVLPSVFAPEDEQHQFNGYIEALTQLSGALEYERTDFFLDLLRTPIAQRPAFVFSRGNKLPPPRRTTFFQLFSTANSVLKYF